MLHPSCIMKGEHNTKKGGETLDDSWLESAYEDRTYVEEFFLEETDDEDGFFWGWESDSDSEDE